MQYTISSPNNWLNKIGVEIDETGTMKLPMKFLMLPLATASEAIEQYGENLGWSEKIKIIQTVALNIRSADTAYFSNWSNSIKISNSTHAKIFPCRGCFEITVSANSLRSHTAPILLKLREEVNKGIIHCYENDKLILPNRIGLARDYYNEFVRLNFFYFPNIEDLKIKFCNKHRKT